MCQKKGVMMMVRQKDPAKKERDPKKKNVNLPRTRTNSSNTNIGKPTSSRIVSESAIISQ